jgi:hypothetical protein
MQSDQASPSLPASILAFCISFEVLYTLLFLLCCLHLVRIVQRHQIYGITARRRFVYTVFTTLYSLGMWYTRMVSRAASLISDRKRSICRICPSTGWCVPLRFAVSILSRSTGDYGSEAPVVLDPACLCVYRIHRHIFVLVWAYVLFTVVPTA